MQNVQYVQVLKRKIIERELAKSDSQILQLIQNYQPTQDITKKAKTLPFETYVYPIYQQSSKNFSQELAIDEEYYESLQAKIINQINSECGNHLYESIKSELQEQIYLNQQKKQIKNNQLKTLESIIEEMDKNKEIQKLIANRQSNQIKCKPNNQNNLQSSNICTQREQNMYKTQSKNIFKKRHLTSTPCFQINIGQSQPRKIKKISIPLKLDKINKKQLDQVLEQKQKIYSLRSHGSRTYRKLNFQKNQEGISSKLHNKDRESNQNHASSSQNADKNRQKNKKNDKLSPQLQQRLRQVAYYQIEYYKHHEQKTREALRYLQQKNQGKFQNYQYRKQLNQLTQRLNLVRKKIKKLVKDFWKDIKLQNADK